MMKISATMVLGLTLTAGLIAGMTGCSSADSGDVPSVSLTSTTEHFGGGRGDEIPRAARGVTDPGVRGGTPGAGGPIAGLNENELALWNEGRERSTEVEATCDDCSDYPPGSTKPPGADPQATNSAGLGGRFNANVCTSACHSQPSLGGTSPAINPSFAIASAKGATNIVPWFETLDGPTREVRFLFNPDGTRDGGVHQKFTVRGRSDAPACTLAQPDFEAQRGNMSFRIPTPMFGLGLMDSIQDVEILAHKNSNLIRKNALGIHGITNNSPNDGTISRFGWKAQNKSITVFAGEAYNVEMGVTNELNPTSKTEDDTCNLGAEPNDVTRTANDAGDDGFLNPLGIMSDWMMFSLFMRFTDQPTPVALDASAQRGLDAFNQIGCGECHTPSMQTKAGDRGPNSHALRGQTVNLYSDILVHHMGANLADNVIQGDAGPDMFRTAPLWGVGQRIFFLHDGRARTLTDAIMAHYSPATAASGRNPAYPASEANQVVRNFADLPAGRQQDIINFLRSL